MDLGVARLLLGGDRHVRPETSGLQYILLTFLLPSNAGVYLLPLASVARFDPRLDCAGSRSYEPRLVDELHRQHPGVREEAPSVACQSLEDSCSST